MLRQTKRIAVGVVGGLVLLAGIAMIVLPGPAFLVIPAGLAILATEFEWAHRLMHRVREMFEKSKQRIQARARRRARESR